MHMNQLANPIQINQPELLFLVLQDQGLIRFKNNGTW